MDSVDRTADVGAIVGVAGRCDVCVIHGDSGCGVWRC